MLEQLTSNLAGNSRREILDGRDYLVVPVSMIVTGVLNGSKGPLYYPTDEIIKNYGAWNGMPIVVNHPTDDSGNPISARAPDVIRKYGVGTVYNAEIRRITDDVVKLGAEAWFDIRKTGQVVPQLIPKLEAGEPVELSTGLFTDNVPVKNGEYSGKKYVAIARNYQPDHLAILPTTKGACSVKDGCGVNVNQSHEIADDEDLEPYQLDWDDPTDNDNRGTGAEIAVRNTRKLAKPKQTRRSKRPTRNELANVSPAKACKILKDGTVRGKKLTPKQKRMFGALCGQTQNKELDMPLSKKQRDRIIDSLIANSEGPWEEEDREGLETLSDEKLERLYEYEQLAANADPADDDDVDDYDVDDGGEGAVANDKGCSCASCSGKKGVTANRRQQQVVKQRREEPREMSEEEYLANAPPRIRSAINNALRFEQERKEALIKTITANKRSRFTKEGLRQKDIPELEALAELAANQDDHDYNQQPTQLVVPHFSGVPGIALNLGEDFAREDQEMAPMPMDWGRED